MKRILKFSTLTLSLAAITLFTGCSDNDNDPQDPNGPFPDESTVTVTLGFKDVPTDLIGGPTPFGANLYFGYPDQVTGYSVKLHDDTYAQFPVNYAEQIWTEGKPWQYTFYNGGLAVSNWHDMTGDTYENQLSVYNTTSPSGGNFVVAFGHSDNTDPMSSTLADYDECARIYITDSKGYQVNPENEKSFVTGDEKEAYFRSVMVANTTYTYLSLKNGNSFSSGVNEENKGWFKVQFIAFNDNGRDSQPVGYVEAYLANFDSSLQAAAGYMDDIRTDWFEVDLTSLDKASVLVINFVGSDVSDFGLNTPGYCALDNFVIVVEDD